MTDTPPNVTEGEPDPPVFGGQYANRILWGLVAAVVILVLVAINQRAHDARQDRDAARKDRTIAITIQNNSIDDAVARCESGNDFRKLFRDYLETQAQPNFTAADVKLIKGYNDLEPAAKVFIDSIAEARAQGAADAETVRKAYIKGFPIVNCGKLRNQLEAKAQRILRTSINGPVVAYANCKEVRDAGVAPLRRGEPGYNPALDRDKDGVACS